MTTSIDNTYMSVARIMMELSGDPNTPVGACIVDPIKNVIVSNGTNRLPDGCENYFPEKYVCMLHAEENAIVKRSGDIEGCTLYTTLFPCDVCAKLIVQSKIGKVVYSSSSLGKKFKLLFEASERILMKAGIPTIQL